MEEKELREIEAKEREQAAKNIKEMLKRKKIDDISLLYKDKFNLETQKACYSLAGSIPTQALIPLYEKVLFVIQPFPSLEIFEREEGCKIDQVIEWRKKGWIETLLVFPHRYYVGLDYLDELVSVSPSRSTRAQEYITLLAGGSKRVNDLLTEGKHLFRGVTAPEWAHHLFGKQKGEDLYFEAVATNYVDLTVFGLTSVVETIEKIVKSGDGLFPASLIAYIAPAFLVSPFTRALRKTMIYPSELKDLAKTFYQNTKPKSEVFFAPCWLADVYTNFGADIPDRMDTDEVNAVRKHSEDFVRSVKSLDEEVDKAVRERFGGGELDRSVKEAIVASREEFRRRWFEDVVPAFGNISTARKILSIGMTGSIVAPAMALPAFTGILGVPAAITALVSAGKIKELVDPAADYLAAFWEHNPIHMGFYKVHKEIEKVRKSSKHQKDS